MSQAQSCHATAVWVAVALTFASWVVSLAGVAGIQQQCADVFGEPPLQRPLGWSPAVLPPSMIDDSLHPPVACSHARWPAGHPRLLAGAELRARVRLLLVGGNRLAQAAAGGSSHCKPARRQAAQRTTDLPTACGPPCVGALHPPLTTLHHHTTDWASKTTHRGTC
jgi:hypothetical protein